MKRHKSGSGERYEPFFRPPIAHVHQPGQDARAAVEPFRIAFVRVVLEDGAKVVHGVACQAVCQLLAQVVLVVSNGGGDLFLENAVAERPVCGG